MFSPDWFLPFVSLDISLWEKVVRTIGVYLVIAVLIRVGGKRLLAQMNSLDLVVVLLLSNVVQNAIIGPDNSVLGGVVGAVVLVGFNAAVDRFVESNRFAGRLLLGSPTELISDGRLDEAALSRLGVNAHELNLALRRQGAAEVAEVQRATIQPAGEILIDLEPGRRAATCDDLAAAVAELKALISAKSR